METTTRKVGRPRGSKNIVSKGSNVQILNFDKQIEGAAVARDSNMGWINYGQHNNYPQELLDLYQNSPTHHAAIMFGVQSIVQNGLDYDAMKLDKTQVFPNTYYSWDTLIRNISQDYLIYGSYCIEIIKNRDNQTFSFYHIPYEKVRCSPYDEDGQITSYWISNDWTNIGMNPPIEIDAIDMMDENVIKLGKPYVYVLKNYDPTMVYYQSPIYAAGIKAIQSEAAYVTHDLKHISNGMTCAGVLTLNDVDDDEQKRSIIKNISSLFTGAENTNQIAIAFRRNVDEKPVEWTPLTDKATNANQYADANNRTISRILCSHQIPSPMLVGLPDMNNAGFSSDANKIEMAFQLYQRLTGNYNREQVIKSLNDMFKLNKIEVEIIQKPLHFNDFKEESTVEQNVKSEEVTQDISTENIEEKVEK